MKLINTLKKTVISIHEMLDPVGVTRSKPRYLFLEEKLDPAGNPRTNVYKRDVDNFGSGPSN